jgi:hypothetical protein
MCGSGDSIQVNMTNLTVSKTNDYFEYKGRRFFYLADCVWPAFAKISFTEWEEYLEYRRMQGFNVLQIWLQNRSIFGNRPAPFRFDAAGKPDYTTMDEEYFERARKMLAMAVQKGFIPALALLWSDKVKGTWLSNQFGPDHVMSPDAIQRYAEYVAKAFAEFEPIYLVSGDTNFGSEETSQAYLLALDTIKSICPEALTTMHIWGDSSYLPDEIVQSSNLDFYIYQSGHKRKLQHLPHQFAQDFYHLPVKRPIVNGEPCIEGLHGLLGWGEFEQARFSAFDVRKAIWRSLLSGAKAGVGYGAFGIWPWHTDNEPLWQEQWMQGEEPWEGEKYFGQPYPWRTALRFAGAWDASFARWIFETYNLFDLEPQSSLLNKTEEIRMSASADLGKVVIYIPYAVEVKVGLELSGYDWTLVNLADRTMARPEVEVNKDSSTIKMHCFTSDALVIGVK